jgi:acetyl-CoA synthetase
MLEQFLPKTEFSSYEDFTKNFRIKVPERFNFAYGVMDRIAAREPGRRALVCCDDKGNEAQFNFGELAE